MNEGITGLGPQKGRACDSSVPADDREEFQSNFNLLGKSHLIFKFLSIISYVTMESHETSKPCNSEPKG